MHACRYEEFPQAEQAQEQLVHTMCIVPGPSTGPPTVGIGPAQPSSDQSVLWTCTGSGSAFIYRTADSNLLRKVGTAASNRQHTYTIVCVRVCTCVSALGGRNSGCMDAMCSSQLVDTQMQTAGLFARLTNSRTDTHKSAM